MRILITAGPTREYLDSVRFITNASSGKMGFALAEAAATRGHDVTVVAGPVELALGERIRRIDVTTAQEMLDACETEYAECDAAIMTAAVCDFRPAEPPSSTKIPRMNGSHVVRCIPTKDICASLGAKKKNQIVIGFALEDGFDLERAEAKLKSKNCDAIVLNTQQSLATDFTSILVFRRGHGWSAPMSGTKRDIATKLIDLTEALFADLTSAGR